MTMRCADRGVQQAQIIVDLGDGADRRARTPARGLLLDGDRWRQAVDRINVGPLHLVQELPRVRRERLDIPPLSFRIDGVERERRFPRAAEPGDHRERVPRNLHADVLQVVLASPPDCDVLDGHDVDNCCNFEAGPTEWSVSE